MPDDWQDALLDPYHHDRQQGRAAGQAAAEQASYDDGYDVGETTGIEYGLEIGFVEGVLDQLKQSRVMLDNEKARKTVAQLRDALRTFPTVEHVLRHRPDDDDSPDSPNEGVRDGHDITTAFEMQHDASTDHDAGIQTVRDHLQRVRARYRLLLSQIDQPALTLAHIMSMGPQGSGAHGNSTGAAASDDFREEESDKVARKSDLTW